MTTTPESNPNVFDKRDKRMRTASKILRWVTLGSLLLFVLAATSLHALGYAAPSIHALCPYGGLESMLSIIAVGTFLKKILIGTFVLFGATVLLAIVMRRSFCGQVCAFGFLQELFGKLGRKLFKKRPVVPQKLDKVLRYLKFVVLAVTVAMAWITGELWVTPYDPFNALGHLTEFNALITSYLIGFIVLIITLLGSLVYDRFFCKYLCPVGALYGVIGKVSPYSIRVNPDKCIRCGLCNKVCPMNVEVMDAKGGRVTDMECINCNICVNACPKKGALSTGFTCKKTLHPLVATILALTLFFAPIGIAAATGNMQLLANKFTNNRSEAGHEDHDDEDAFSSGGYGEGESAIADEEHEESYVPINGYEPSDIRGSLSLSQVADMLGMSLDDVYARLGLADDYPSATTIKTAAEDMGYGLGDFKHLLFE
jgi:NapH/MauN family ferredoxin-type protein